MRNKPRNPKLNYTEEQHAIAMFEENYRWIPVEKDEFDILPYSERYYYDNHECFRHKDKLEIMGFIRILIENKLIEKTGLSYHLVRLTENGKKRIEEIREYKEKYKPYSI